MKRKNCLSIVLLVSIIAVSILLVGGGVVLARMPESMVETTQEPRPTPTATLGVPTIPPVLTPIPSPTPAPTTVAEYEEEKAKLGILDEDMIIPSNYVECILYETDSGEMKIAFVVDGYNSQYCTLSDLFTMENLYTFDYSAYEKVFAEGNNESVKPVNAALSSYKFVRLSAPVNMRHDLYPNITGDWLDELYRFFEKNFNVFYTKSELADIYLKYIPKEYRVYGSDFVPGKKAHFPEITPSPVPTAPTP